MKPISQLKAAGSGTTVRLALIAFLKVLSNPKRHLRGPRFGLRPGNGKLQYTNDCGNRRTAVCGCAIGILDIVAKDRTGEERVHRETHAALTSASIALQGRGFINVSDDIGLRAIRKVATKALADLGSVA